MINETIQSRRIPQIRGLEEDETLDSFFTKWLSLPMFSAHLRLS